MDLLFLTYWAIFFSKWKKSNKLSFTLISAYKLQDNHVKQDLMMQVILFELNMQKTLYWENFICQTRVLLQSGQIYFNFDMVWFVLDKH